MRKNAIYGAIIFIAGLTALHAQAPDPRDVLAAVDRNLNFETDFSCRFTMVTYRAGETPETQEMTLFSRPERVDGEEKFLAIVIKPDVDKGTGYLMQGDNFWIYDPESRRFSHSTARDSVQDSDVNNDDLGTADFVEDYAILAMTEGMLGKIDCWILDLEAKTESVDYSRIRVWVGKKELIPYKEEDYSLTGTLMRTVLAPKWSLIEGKYIYRQVYFNDNLKEGNRTVLVFDQVSLNALPDHLFTKAYLEESSR